MKNIKQIRILLGKKIREQRKQKKMSIEQLAEESGLHTTHVGDIERGDANVTITSLAKIALALEVEISEFFTFSGYADKKILMRKLNNLIHNKEKVSALNELGWIINELLFRKK